MLVNTRQHILAATERIIQSKGLARVTTREIAREAGCAEGTLYKHFADKETLFLAVMQEYLPDLVETVCVESAGQGTLSENLQNVGLAVITYYEKLIPLSVSLFADLDLLAHHRYWMQEQQLGPLNIYTRVAAYLRAEQELGRVKPGVDPFAVAATLLGPCHQYVYVQYFHGYDPFPRARHEFIRGIVQTLLIGLESATI